jgi:putative transcriptional regulator
MSAAPILLLSMPQMADPNFAETVVLLCDYTDEGAFGLVVNRRMTEPASKLVRTEPAVTVDPDFRVPTRNSGRFVQVSCCRCRTS